MTTREWLVFARPCTKLRRATRTSLLEVGVDWGDFVKICPQFDGLQPPLGTVLPPLWVVRFFGFTWEINKGDASLREAQAIVERHELLESVYAAYAAELFTHGFRGAAPRAYRPDIEKVAYLRKNRTTLERPNFVAPHPVWPYEQILGVMETVLTIPPARLTRWVIFSTGQQAQFAQFDPISRRLHDLPLVVTPRVLGPPVYLDAEPMVQEAPSERPAHSMPLDRPVPDQGGYSMEASSPWRASRPRRKERYVPVTMPCMTARGSCIKGRIARHTKGVC